MASPVKTVVVFYENYALIGLCDLMRHLTRTALPSDCDRKWRPLVLREPRVTVDVGYTTPTQFEELLGRPDEITLETAPLFYGEAAKDAAEEYLACLSEARK